jgi:hypothetical protein
VHLSQTKTPLISRPKKSTSFPNLHHASKKEIWGRSLMKSRKGRDDVPFSLGFRANPKIWLTKILELS